MLFTKNKELVGIDIGSSSVKLVQLSESKGSYKLKNLGLLPLPSEAIVDNSLMDTTSIVEAIKDLMKSLGTKATEVVCSISGNSVIIRKITLPAMTPEELEDQIAWEAEQYIPFDINDVNLDYEILETDLSATGKMTVLLVASKKEIINEYVSVFGEAGLKLVVVDVDSFAVQNIFELNYATAEGKVVALVNIGAAIMNLNVVRDGVSLFTRDIQMGGNLYTEEIQRQFALSSQEAERIKISGEYADQSRLNEIMLRISENLALEIQRSLDFYNSSADDDKIAHVYICGGCSKVSYLSEALSRRLGLSVELLNPLQKVSFDEKEFDPEYLQEIGPLVAVAAGLAMRRLGDK
jgi:type IV pilus assembly protein PilM